MMTFAEFLEDKRVQLYGIGMPRKDTSRCAKRQIGTLFKAVNPANLGLPVVWNMNAAPLGRKKRKSLILGK